MTKPVSLVKKILVIKPNDNVASIWGQTLIQHWVISLLKKILILLAAYTATVKVTQLALERYKLDLSLTHDWREKVKHVTLASGYFKIDTYVVAFVVRRFNAPETRYSNL